MAATAAVNKPPPGHPGPDVGNLHSCPNSYVPNSGQQDPGMHGISQDPGHSSYPQHNVSARPFFYVPAPPPPPFLQYQWPMPFSYNPLAGFSGMGYGMVMPPFPPPPYMEAPAYILPHPHIQPVDYRRLLHPQVHAPNALYQNPNQTRRIRPPHTVPVKETVNSAVQTEPTQRGTGSYGDGSPPSRSDYGHGTSSNSQSSSKSSSQKQGSTEVENYTLPSSNAKDLQVPSTCKKGTVEHSFNTPHPTGTKTVQSHIRATVETHKCRKDSVDQENVVPFRNGHCNMWSVSSPENMVPVCSSSQQEDEVVKERRVSVPDILMSWGGGTPEEIILKMTDKVLPHNEHQLPSYETEVEHGKSVYQSPTEPRNGPVVADGIEANDGAENILSSVKDRETRCQILKLPFVLRELFSESRRENGPVRRGLPHIDEPLHSLNKSHTLPDDEQENCNETYEDTTEIIPCSMFLSSCSIRGKMNESVWSVESLAPFIPTKEWSLQKGMFEPEVIIEMTEEAEDGRLPTKSDNLFVKSSKERRQSRRFSSSDSVPMSDSWLIYSTPAGKESPSKNQEIEIGTDASEGREPKQCQSTAPLERDSLASPTHLSSKRILFTPTDKHMDENGSSETVAIQSPNQESVIVNKQQEKSPCSPEQEDTLLLNYVVGEEVSYSLQKADLEAEDEKCGNEELSQLSNGQLCVPMVDQRMAKVSPKGHLVDCGIQCTELQDCLCEELKGSMGPSRRHPYKYSDIKKTNGCKADGLNMNGHAQKTQKRHSQWRNRSQEKQSNQQEPYSGYCGKPGKPKGGNRRNPRF
ncbi:uncharacterized protein buc2l [Morone saxatilis]|uniref:uncharacterized protein buc2l n=1 Tax=Morone saxatilis TaxID=34816 RepID=UPI0015E1DE72|nr:uncharacterized protein buc2l [Morone saxatilis]